VDASTSYLAATAIWSAGAELAGPLPLAPLLDAVEEEEEEEEEEDDGDEEEDDKGVDEDDGVEVLGADPADAGVPFGNLVVARKPTVTSERGCP